ncbi:MAG TPA: Dna2/Cas4 domain-containing protein [Gemmatimonadaceae bacterium]|nr:Dna2/Cas4 domain-containing protein [Gemmatimonadaceae bacterium]
MALALVVAAALAGILALALYLAAGPLAETEPLLVDEARRIRGRPDYLLRHKKGVIPVELKPLRTSKTLYESDRLQIATYLMLVRTAPYGIVRYKETTFRVYLTKELEARCLKVADEIRAARRATVVHRTHNVPPKCRACAHKAACGEALV